MKTTLHILLGVVLLTTVASHADILKLKQGGGVQGVLVSANSKEIVFMDVNGAQRTYPVSAASGIDFAPLPPASPAADRAGVVTIPSGTQITVRTIDPIDGKTAKSGARYRASIDDPIALGSQVVIPRGTDCTLEVVGVQSGQGMALRLRSINMVGKSFSTSTAYAQVAATGTTKKRSAMRRGVGLGAVGAGIGALAGGGEGAAIGAAVAGGIGAISAAGAKGKQINVPSESRLIFSLSAPLPLN